MRTPHKLPSVALFVLVLASVQSVAQTLPDPGSPADLFVPAIDGLTIEEVDRCLSDYYPLGDDGLPYTGDPNEDSVAPFCVFGYGGASFGFPTAPPFYLSSPVVSMHVRTEFVPDPDATCPWGPPPYYPWALGSWHLDRVLPDGTLQPIGEFRTQCEAGFLRDLLVKNASLDQVEGVLYVSLATFNSQASGVSSNGLDVTVKISGLPTLLDLVPAGPPGLEHFPGPPRPPDSSAPGHDCDVSRVVALEQEIVTLRSQIDALRSAVDRLLSTMSPKSLTHGQQVQLAPTEACGSRLSTPME